MAARSLRVLNLLNNSHQRGAEAFAMDLAAAVARLGAEVRSVALAGRSGPASHDVEVLGSGRRGSAVAAARLLWLCGEVDVIVGHGGRTLAAGAFTRRLTRTPFVYRVIGEPLAWSGPPDSLRRRRVGFALRQADAIVGYVDSQTSELSREFGVDASKVRTIPKGINLRSFTPATTTERERARSILGVEGRGSGGPVVAFVGALTAQKNVEQVVRAVGALDGAVLIVAGSGPHEPALQAIAADVGAEVRFTGALKDPRVAYAAADVVVLTSRTEGVPTVLLEAALMGLPVVATPVGGIKETVQDGKTGFLVELDDVFGTAEAIRAAFERRSEIGPTALTHATATWDINGVAVQWIDLLKGVTSAVSKRPTRPADGFGLS